MAYHFTRSALLAHFNYKCIYNNKVQLNWIFESVEFCTPKIPNMKRDKLSEKAEVDIAIASTQRPTKFISWNKKKVEACRDVQIDESSYWDWKLETSNKNITQDEIPQATTPNEDEASNDSDENSKNEVLRTRSLVDIYNSCNMALLEPESFDKASKSK